MKTNNQTNNLIRNAVIILDFVILNILLWFFVKTFDETETWSQDRLYVLFMTENLALLLSQIRYPSIVHLRKVTVTEILRRITWLVVMQTILTYVLLKVLTGRLPFIGHVINVVLAFSPLFFATVVIVRMVERWIIKGYRKRGGNTRSALMIGDDPALERVVRILGEDATRGYKIDRETPGSLDDLARYDEVYVCLPSTERNRIREIAKWCDGHVVRFYYVQPELENFGLNLRAEQVEDMTVWVTHVEPLMSSTNRLLKRVFDVLFSMAALLFCALLFPVVALIIKCQSPGPVFFRQLRTGLNGVDFICYKFRSMHVNKEADTRQATANDPRKFAFGNFMRKTNIDELPQFWCVLKGDMSVVGPRPHMLKHTELYSQLIGKYMVRHFVKPGITGWAQVTGSRGETSELWQMEERIQKDIWYMENWSFWLDIRIIWMTIKTIIFPDIKAV